MLIRRWIRTSVVTIVALALLTSYGVAEDKRYVEVIQATQEIPEELLLDVGIHVFDTGLPEDPDKLAELEKEGVLSDIRNSESRYIPIHLMNTLQATGFWGAVRLVPRSNPVDLVVTGVIYESNGKRLEVEIEAVDATGKRWLRERYKQEADLGAYNAKQFGMVDPFQGIYNRIANDLLKEKRKQDDEDIARIRTVTELRFAAGLAPVAFDDYLRFDKKGRAKIERLPAHDDPMMQRVASIRERDFMFIDTLNEYYSSFYTQMDSPYDSWRAYSYDEQDALDEVRNKARWNKILRVAAMIGGGVASAKGGSLGRSAGTAGIIIGAQVLENGFQTDGEAQMHVEALRELAASLDGELAPMLLEVEGELVRLTGSADTQYTKWRELLRQVFAEETRLPVDPNTGAPTTGGSSQKQ